MSLILDALNKADQERKTLDEGPSIDASPSDSSSSMRKRNVLLIALAALVLLSLIAILVWLLSGDNDKTSTIEPEKIQASESRSSTPEKPKPNIENNSKSQSDKDEARLSDIRKAYIEAQKQKKTSKQNKESVLTSSTEGKIKNSKVTAESSAIKELYNKPTRETARSENNPANNQSTTSRSVASSINSRFAATKTIKQLPLRLQDDIPSIMYEAHNYQARGTSSITVNGKTVRKSSRINAKVKLVEVTEDGAIFSIDQYEFKLMALSSWINLN